MANSLLIDINASGLFKLEEPFNTLMQIDTIYTCKAVRKLSDIVAEGFDPYERYYLPYSISEADYLLDLQADVAIVSLFSATGQWVYVPSTKIISYPSVNGITYNAIMLGVSLGALPDNVLLDALKTSIANLVTDTLGVDSIIREIVVSPPAIVPTTDHALINTARQAKINIFKSERALYLKAQADLVVARQKIASLELYIRNNRPP